MPIFLECQRCTACCRWPGQVRLTDAEISQLAAFKGMTEHDFIQRFTRLRRDRQGLALQEKANGECVFLEGDDCSVQPVKPQQCRDFPNLWNFPGFEKVCRAIPVELSAEELREELSNPGSRMRRRGGNEERRPLNQTITQPNCCRKLFSRLAITGG